MAAAHTNAEDDSPARVTLAPGVWIARSDLRFTFSRSSGPGGQAVNKLSTRAQLHVPIRAIRGLHEAAYARLRQAAGKRITEDDVLLLTAETFRSQLDNKQACIDRLCDLVTAALREPKIRRKKKPTRGMIERRLQSKRKTSEKKSMRGGRRDFD